MNNSFLLDAEEIPFTPGQTIMQAATMGQALSEPRP